ncbi:hypothetical protein [Microtetraspora malaysiensis]
MSWSTARADGAVAGEGAAFDGAQVALLLAGVQGAGREQKL